MSDAWRAFNAEGLALAHQGRWVDATRVFEEALAVFDVPDVEGRVTSVAKDDARARLMLNIGQCQFHLGAFEESRRFAERSCALRVSLYGEESLVVARTRGDLAVILGASGHTDEAMSLLERAVLAVERKRGDESAHLLPLLTNAARLLARSAPDRARPYISRLKALLFAQKLGRDAEIFQPSELPGYSFAPSPQSSAGDDHLLRRAIAQTVDLLRSTPSTNLAMPGSPPPLPDDVVVTQEQLGHVIPAPQPQRDASVDVVWEYEVPPPVEPPTSSSANVVVGGIDDTVFDLVEPPPPTLNTIPVATAITDKANANPLGFEVQYGIPSQLHESFDNPTVPLPAERESHGSSQANFAEAPIAELLTAEQPVAESHISESRIAESPIAESPIAPIAVRSGMRAVGGVRRGSTQVVAMNRVWIVAACVGAFTGGIGAFLLYNYVKSLIR